MTRAHSWDTPDKRPVYERMIEGLRADLAAINEWQPEPLPVRRGRFTRQEVHEIREARERGVSLNALARRYGVTRQAISQIARGRVYRNVR